MYPKPHARPRGRPQNGADDNRERLVNVGRDLFAAAGYAATSLRQIALGAGVTPALAHYYFKDKSGLLDAVLRERIAPLMHAVDSALTEPATDAVAAVAGFIQQFTLISSRNPWLPQLLLRELADSADPPNQIMASVAARLRALIAAGQASHAIRCDLPAESIVLSVLSLCAFPFLAGSSLRRELGISADAASATAMTLQHLAVLQDGLKPRDRTD